LPERVKNRQPSFEPVRSTLNQFIELASAGYDLPRRISLAQLAEKLDLARSTLDAHLRKAERLLLNHVMSES